MRDFKNKQNILFYRPLMLIAFFLTFGILIGHYLLVCRQTAATLFVLGVVCLFLFIISHRRISVVILALASFGVGVFLISCSEEIESVPAGEAVIIGRVVDIAHYDTTSYYTLDDWTVSVSDWTINPKKKIRISAENKTLAFGDVISFSSEIDYPDIQRNLYGFNEHLYLLSNGIGYIASLYDDEIQIIKNQKKMDTAFYHARMYVSERIDTAFSDETKGIAKGLILGDKSGISETDYEAYKRGGAASVLAVSGLHMGIISLFFFWLLRFVAVGRKPAHIITGMVMFFYAGLVGFSISSIRALMMGGIVIVANLLGRRKEPFSFLCLAYVLALIICPSSLFTAGFMLSFGAVFAILLLTPKIINALKRWPKQIAGLVATTLSAWVGTAPILVNTFNFVSLIGLFVNLIIIPIASITVILVLLSLLPGLVGNSIAFLGQTLISLMNIILHTAERVPLASVAIKNLPVVFIVSWFALIFIISSLVMLKKKTKQIIAGFCLVLMIAMLLFIPQKYENQMYIYFFDVGQGDAILIHTPERKNYLIDTGRSYAYRDIERYLKSTGLHLDGLFLTHSDQDHIGSYETLVQEGFVQQVYISSVDCFEYEMDEAEIIRISRGDEINLDSQASLYVLNPSDKMTEWNTNQQSLCMLFQYNDKKILLTGDIDDEIEEKLFSVWTDIDILKVTHHGSAYGSTQDFMEKTQPEIAIISCGKNIYGHPAPQTLYNLNNTCDIIYRTDILGGIMIILSDDIEIETVIQE